ncbi:MAG: cupin domain-containing protein [Thermomicrobiaceae bacterium]|nr:cupin domain-containing protein [Thermomicrobiaceae bacterium]
MGSQAESVNWADVPREEVYPGIARQAVHGERQTLVRYVYQPGAVFPVHQHPQEQVTAVLSGQIEFEVAGRRLTLGPGDVAVIPGDTPHGARVVGDAVVETLNALSPRREQGPGPERA